MGQEAFYFDVVAYAIIVISALMILGISFLYMRDAVNQEPRFAKVLKYLGFIFVLGLLFIAANLVLPWIPFYILGMTFAGTPTIIVLFVIGSFLHEAAKTGAGIAIAVLGSFGGVGLGILLLVLKRFLEHA